MSNTVGHEPLTFSESGVDAPVGATQWHVFTAEDDYGLPSPVTCRYCGYRIVAGDAILRVHTVWWNEEIDTARLGETPPVRELKWMAHQTNRVYHYRHLFP